jgi:U3 small nucleolar RNA-associated protein 7
LSALAFQPKAKQKGRSSKASLVKRKKTVMDQEHRDKVRRSLEQRKKKQDMAKPPGARPSALDRFV